MEGFVGELWAGLSGDCNAVVAQGIYVRASGRSGKGVAVDALVAGVELPIRESTNDGAGWIEGPHRVGPVG